MQFEAEFYHNNLRDITEVDKLYAIKDKLDNQVTNPAMNWSGRMLIYKQVQMILYRMRELVLVAA